jgi:hypothetical protein
VVPYHSLSFSSTSSSQEPTASRPGGTRQGEMLHKRTHTHTKRPTHPAPLAFSRPHAPYVPLGSLNTKLAMCWGKAVLSTGPNSSTSAFSSPGWRCCMRPS